MNHNGRSLGPEGVLEAYVDACRRCEVAALRDLFHPAAAMHGFLGGQAMTGSPEPFFEAVAGSAPPGPDYRGLIEAVHSEGGIAWGVLREQNFLGMNFLNHFQLMETEGHWLIVAKLFEST